MDSTVSTGMTALRCQPYGSRAGSRQRIGTLEASSRLSRRVQATLHRCSGRRDPLSVRILSGPSTGPGDTATQHPLDPDGQVAELARGIPRIRPRPAGA
jgi:hypothetical protein